MQQRQQVIDYLKGQIMLANYGFPPQIKLTQNEAMARFRAIQEIWVRMNLFVTTGESSKGTIDFPQAKRRIYYEFNSKHPENTIINLRAV